MPSKVNVSYHLPCALFHYFFSQDSTDCWHLPIFVGVFSYSHGQNNCKIWLFIHCSICTKKFTRYLHYEMPSTFPIPKNSKRIPKYQRIPNELRRRLIFLVKSAFSGQNSRRILGADGFSYTNDWRYECSSRIFFVQICKIKGAANFYPRCDKLLANSPVRYFRLLRPCMHKCHHTNLHVFRWFFK